MKTVSGALGKTRGHPGTPLLYWLNQYKASHKEVNIFDHQVFNTAPNNSFVTESFPALQE